MVSAFRFIVAAGAVVIGGMIAMQPAEAYKNNNYLPPGTWVNSCWNAEIDGYTLYATCKDRRGYGRDTSVDMRGCASFGNDDGELYCEAYGGGGGGGNNGGGYRRPEDVPGSWYESCSNARLQYGTLSATCRTKHNKWRNSSVDVRRCYNVENNDGYLVCTQ